MLNWNNKSRQFLYGSVVFLIGYIFLTILALRPPFAFDSYWHLQMGKDLLENGLSPWFDHYSFTYHGKEISSVPIVFQLILASFVSAFGELSGFYFFKLAYITALMLVIYLYFRQIKASWFIAFLIVPLLIYFIHIRLIIRPELLSNVLSVICLSLYLRARTSFVKKELILICLLLLLWVNIHTPVFGYIIIFGLFMDKAINKIISKDNSFSWNFWVIWGLVVFFIGFINRESQHFFISMISFLPKDFGKYTQEYMPSYQFYSMNKIVIISWVLSLYITVWSVIKKQYGLAIIAIILAYFSWSMTRLVTSVAIVNLCILAYSLSQLRYSSLLSIKPYIRNILLVVSVCISTLALYIVLKDVFISWSDNENKEDIIDHRYPAQVADYLKSYQEGGNILNHMGSGGYLIYKLSPDFKVYIDGRTNILYPIEFLKHYSKINTDSEALKHEVENSSIQYAVFKNNPDKLLSFKAIDKFSINFANESFVLFSENKNTSFPLSSALMVYPMCWRDAYSSAIKQEIVLSEKLLSDKTYTLKSVLALLDKYISSKDKALFLEGITKSSMTPDSERRLAAYMALYNQEYKVSLELFSLIEFQNDDDMLMLAHSLVGDEKYTDAEAVLFYFYTLNKFIKKKNVSFDRIAILAHLLKIIQGNVELKKFRSTYVSELEEKLLKVNYNNGEPIKTVIPFQNACESFFNR